MACGFGACVRVAAALLVQWPLVQAQIYSFSGEKVPNVRSLNTIYAFYVYSFKEAPDNEVGKPYVKFQGLTLEPLPTATEPGKYAEYNSVQMSIMRYQDFWTLIDTQRFCSGPTDVDQGAAKKEAQLLLRKPPDGESLEEMGVHVYTVRSTPLPDARHNIEHSGIYTLVFSNCGELDQASVSGAVTVKNAYGFLPGNEFPKMQFYGTLLVVYLCLAATWMVLSFCFMKELLNIQNCIALVILLGLLECFLWYLFFNDWNSNGVRGKALFTLATLFTVMKSTFSYMLVLVASLGWGITRPYLDNQVIMKIQALCFVYIVLDFIREVVLSFRHSHSLSIAFVLLCLLPVSLLNGAIFAWIFTALPNLMETLKERRQMAKLLLFQRLWYILMSAISVATFALLYQIFMFSSDMTQKWRQQWLFTDGVSHGLFLFVLVAMMYLWAPHKYSQRFAYSDQVESEDEKSREASATAASLPGAIWVDDEDDEEADSFWQATKAEAPRQAREVEVIGQQQHRA